MNLTNLVGGGEILNVSTKSQMYQYLNNTMIGQFKLLGIVKIIIIALLLYLCFKTILYFLNINHLFKSKTIAQELDYISKVKQKDAFVLRVNKFLFTITKFINATPFKMSAVEKDYMQYNLQRADVKVPGGFRNITVDEYNALLKVAQVLLSVVCIFVSIFVNSMIGIIMLMVVLFGSGFIAKAIIRTIVLEKDNEILDNFADLYLMLHYVMKNGGKTPLSKVLQSYTKTTDSLEMQKFIQNCVDEIDTYGEYQATRVIAKQYKELAPVNKLMRLIRQMHEGGNISKELDGFRNEIIKEKEYNLKKKEEKMIAKAQMSFNILMIVLVQAILSAMAIYLPDLSLLGNFLS